MTDMIERVARAICRELGMNPDQEHYAGLSDQIGREWEQFEGAARAAIEAMRGDVVPVFEDISNMDKEWKQSALPADVLNAGECACWDNGGRSFGYNGVLNIWRAMIDAALKGDKP